MRIFRAFSRFFALFGVFAVPQQMRSLTSLSGSTATSQASARGSFWSICAKVHIVESQRNGLRCWCRCLRGWWASRAERGACGSGFCSWRRLRGTWTTAGNIAAAAPASGSYTTFITDNLGNLLSTNGTSGFPHPNRFPLSGWRYPCWEWSPCAEDYWRQ